MESIHDTVLLQEAVDALDITPGDTVVDATFGAGGHAAKILDALGPDGRYVGIDVDATALQHPVGDDPKATLVKGNFRDIETILETNGIASPDGILADLGWRMDQFEGGEKGFSFRHDEPLLMTLGNHEDYSFTASDIVNEWDEETIANIVYGYGEDRFARRIASRITAERTTNPITTSVQLADIVSAAVPAVARRGKTHPATKTFQALRIAVNEELQVLETFIESAIDALSDDGRLAIISFHSLEDRIVKHAFRAAANASRGMIETKKPITPSEEELLENKRARSAKLRIFTKHHDNQETQQNTFL